MVSHTPRSVSFRGKIPDTQLIVQLGLRAGLEGIIKTQKVLTVPGTELGLVTSPVTVADFFL
jgi:hypothetical protein